MSDAHSAKGRLLIAGALFASSTLAFGHAVIDNAQKPANTFQFIELRITHGCGEAPTNRVTVSIPHGVTRVSPRHKTGWNVSVRMR